MLHEADSWGERWRVDVAVQGQTHHGKNHLDRAEGPAEPEICHVLGVAMTSTAHQTEEGRDLLSAVALLSDLPGRGLVRGQVGTIVEPLDEATALVEFSDD